MSKLKLLRPAGLGHWIKLYCLYTTAFPASERKPFSIIARMYRKGKADIWCMEQNGRFAGFAATINGDGLILLDYFAVERKFRGRGIGTGAVEMLQQLYADKGLFVEIESTCENAPNREEREKRKEFYLRCGMEPLHVMANVFGVNMELLGSRCRMDFARYQEFYREHYSPWAAEHISKEIHPDEGETHGSGR